MPAEVLAVGHEGMPKGWVSSAVGPPTPPAELPSKPRAFAGRQPSLQEKDCFPVLLRLPPLRSLGLACYEGMEGLCATVPDTPAPLTCSSCPGQQARCDRQGAALEVERGCQPAGG